ncbi:MAG TPA: helix-hairpin-helix domain-containing protein, partial [Gemmatimonadales bacterium]|nr:helix-hairpin-helix domain-containing protein [Gemmatimonadales bacterium]
ALGAERTVRSILSRDLTALSSVSGVGRKKAERLVLELQDKFGDVSLQTPAARSAGADEAVQALVGLGYAPGAADEAVRAVVADGPPSDASQLIRRALQRLAAARGAR